MKNDGGSAFPVPMVPLGDGGYTNSKIEGLSLRDYFAAKALAAQIGHDATLISIVNVAKECNVSSHEVAARSAYQYADAMLAAREAK